MSGGFLNRVVLVFVPPGPLLKECMNTAKHKKNEEGSFFCVDGQPPPPVHLTSSLRNLMWMFLIRGHFTALKPKGV